MSLNNNWFTEYYQAEGLAFSLQLADAKKLAEKKTAFQTIEIYQTSHFGKLMVIDGCIMLTSRDNFIYHEMMAHPALFSHPNPQNILIIGGGDCGTLNEVLKHPSIISVQQVDIDEQVTRLSEEFFPELCINNHHPKAELYFADGIKWVEDADDESYDVIIVDSTDPVGPGEVLFTEQFYQQSHRILKTDGLLVQQSESPLIHTQSIIMPMINKLKSAGFVDYQTLNFPLSSYPTGWWSCTLACKDKKIAEFSPAAVDKRPFITHYYNAEIHRACSAMPEFFKQAIQSMELKNGKNS